MALLLTENQSKLCSKCLVENPNHELDAFTYAILWVFESICFSQSAFATL